LETSQRAFVASRSPLALFVFSFPRSAFYQGPPWDSCSIPGESGFYGHLDSLGLLVACGFHVLLQGVLDCVSSYLVPSCFSFARPSFTVVNDPWLDVCGSLCCSFPSRNPKDGSTDVGSGLLFSKTNRAWFFLPWDPPLFFYI